MENLKKTGEHKKIKMREEKRNDLLERGAIIQGDYEMYNKSDWAGILKEVIL